MQVLVLGVNHKTAPISIREKFYLTDIEQDLLLSELKLMPSVVEAFAVSTCNRTEIYVHVIQSNFPSAELVQLVCSIKKIPFSADILSCFYVYKDEEMIRHILEVACGLNSLVLGEKQILGQVRDAFERSKHKGFLSTYFNILSNIVIRCGKKARTETHIDCGGSSVSWAAITKAEEELKGLADKNVLMIGAGQMSKLAIGQFSNRGFQQLYLMNRTRVHAEKLAEKISGEVVSFCDIKETLAKVDLCVCCSSAPHYILEKDLVEKVMQASGKEKLVILDISMPRNVDPTIHEVENVSLYDIDDLDSVVAKNMEKRHNAVEKVYQIIEEKILQYNTKVHRCTTHQKNFLVKSI